MLKFLISLDDLQNKPLKEHSSDEQFKRHVTRLTVSDFAHTRDVHIETDKRRENRVRSVELSPNGRVDALF
jgi:hypothetical protein